MVPGRAGSVDRDALVEALVSGALSDAIIDVYDRTAAEGVAAMTCGEGRVDGACHFR